MKSDFVVRSLSVASLVASVESIMQSILDYCVGGIQMPLSPATASLT